ncbi:beta-lactamase [Legionella norrlandica]|uniref:Beta-lactamase n=1 Tax=Legionella norrlandica TaxID=1498499 RepID=A0A0A2SUB7_9GAMM|nr:MBL fold metallo-hydrolase [Legionella norrlandica]KGP64337.1 beta-lactamase [Legionella norrlandica]
MRNVILFESDSHQFILLNESDPGEENGIRSNQYLIKHHANGILLDPGGFNVMPQTLSELLRYLNPDSTQAIILSHQDPDIVAGIATWMELIQAPIYISRIWIRFLPHYGIKDTSRFFGVPDVGMDCIFENDFHLKIIPAHFLHSEGQMNVYDPVSKILFSGDIGAACLPDDQDYAFVDDFEKHLPFIESFHRRYMCGNKAARAWVSNISKLDINMIAPQHGPIYRGQSVCDFINWFKNLRCGMDLMSSGGHFKE